MNHTQHHPRRRRRYVDTRRRETIKVELLFINASGSARVFFHHEDGSEVPGLLLFSYDRDAWVDVKGNLVLRRLPGDEAVRESIYAINDRREFLNGSHPKRAPAHSGARVRNPKVPRTRSARA